MYGAWVPRPLHSAPYKKLRVYLVEARHTASLTQLEVADRMGRPQSFVSKYENGERRLDVIEFIEVCSAIGLSPDRVIRLLTSQHCPKADRPSVRASPNR